LVECRGMSTRYKLLHLLDDQRCQSGSVLGQRLGVSRAAVQQHIAALRRQGVPIVSMPRSGYRLQPGVALLSEERINALLPTATRAQLTRLLVLNSVDSTNDELLRLRQAMHGAVCLAEMQQSGRGRRGRRWFATPYRNVLMSIGWVYPEWPVAISSLGLVMALAVTRALEASGISDVGVKWPNDLVWQQRKLGGILVDLNGEAGGACSVVVGVGINVVLDPEHDAADIEQPWVDLAAITGKPLDRNVLIAHLVTQLFTAMSEFPEGGLAALIKEWQAKHVLEGLQVDIESERGPLLAQVVGVDNDGALLVQDPSGIEHKFFHGEVRIRGWR